MCGVGHDSERQGHVSPPFFSLIDWLLEALIVADDDDNDDDEDDVCLCVREMEDEDDDEDREMGRGVPAGVSLCTARRAPAGTHR